MSGNWGSLESCRGCREAEGHWEGRHCCGDKLGMLQLFDENNDDALKKLSCSIKAGHEPNESVEEHTDVPKGQAFLELFEDAWQ